MILSLLSLHLSGRTQEDKINNGIAIENIASLLPPLETIIDSAIANNASIKFRDLQIEINNHKLISNRAEWTKDFGFQADVAYGTQAYLETSVSENLSTTLTTTPYTETNYSLGAYLRIPIYDFLNRKNQIKLDKAEIQQAQSLSQVQRNDLRQIIIKQYNDLIVKQKLMNIKIKYNETTKLRMQMVEKEFINGSVSLGDYSSFLEISSRAESELESAKMDFRTSYMIFEEIVGIKFNLLSKIQ